MPLSNWLHPTDGIWEDTANWDPAHIPNSSDDVQFVSSFSPYTVTMAVDIAEQVSTVVLGGEGVSGITLQFNSGTSLTTAGNFTDFGLSGGEGSVADFVKEFGASVIVGGNGVFNGTAGHLNWQLNSGSTAQFSGQITGGGISFTFEDGTSDHLIMGAQGTAYAGNIIGFQGSNTIDLKGLVYGSGGYTAVAAGAGLQIRQGLTTVFTFTGFSVAAGFSTSNIAITSDSGTGTLLTICFAAGTQIAAESGAIAVENLQPGHRVVTLQAGAPVMQEVRWIGRRQLDLRAHPQIKAVAPVRIAANAFADGVPHRDLIVSPDHAVLADGGLIPARMLINGMTIRQETGLASVEYFHVELDSHSILLAEGLATESYLETGHRGFFSNAAEPTILHPDMTAAEQARAEAQPCAPFLLDEASVRPVWQRLHDRAVAAGLVSEAAETTRNAELRVLAGGREFQPMEVAAGRLVFALPAGLQSARLVSRAAAPADSQPWLNDRRQLGVAVERIELRSADGMEEVAIDHPALSQGWWQAERAGNALQRWTNGDATIPLPNGPVLLELTIAGTGFYSVAATDDARHAA